MESIISMFHIDWKIIIAQAVNFAIVFTVLYIYALKPLGKLMAERSQKIGKGIEDAKKNEELLKRAEEEYEKALAKARAEADKIFEIGKKEAEAKRNQMLSEAKDEVAALIENGKKMLESEKAKAVADAQKDIAALAIAAAEKILGGPAGSVNERNIKELNNL